MHALHATLFLLWLVGSPAAVAPEPHADPCAELYDALAAVPHLALARKDGPLESTWDRHAFRGCEIDFRTDESTLDGASVPNFWADDPSSPLHRAGWRMVPQILADGPGSGIYAIARRRTRCVIRWAQPAYVDDDGAIVVSETFTMLVQCETVPGP